MKQNKRKISVTTTCLYDENGEEAKNILATSFGRFLANEAEKSYHVTNGWLLIGGTKCTQE